MTPFDVSDQSRLAELGLRLAAIVDSSNDAIISKNLDGVIVTWNQAATQLLGYLEEEAIGQPINIIIPPELFNEEKEILRRLRAGEHIQHYITRRITREGRLLDVSLTISPVRDSAGTIVGASKILRDVTEYIHAQASLREAQQRLEREIAGARTLQSISTRLISECNQDSLFSLILDAAMELMAADAGSVQLLNQDNESLTLLAWRNFHPESVAYWQHVTVETECACGVALRNWERVLIADTEICEFLRGTQDLQEYRRSGIRAAQTTPLLSREGRPLGMISTHWRAPHTPTEDDFRLFDVLARQAADLIERTRTESALRESEERFRLLANAVPVIIWMTDLNLQCTYMNQTCLNLTGQSFEAMLGAGWQQVVSPDDVTEIWSAFSKAIERREPFDVEFRLRRHDGEFFWVICRGVPRYNGDGSLTGYIGSAMDISEKKLAKEALATINQRLIDAQDEERSRIARELHDDITQRLALLSISLSGLSQATHVSSIKGRQTIEKTRQEAAALAKDVQAISHRLHPARLDYLNFGVAAAALCREISNQHGVEISFRADGVPVDLSNRIAVCLYRVLQEALQNAIKHSGAQKVDVSLCRRSDQMELSVSDHGAGFDLNAMRGRGLGLVSMQERLKTVNGRLDITSEPDRGTTIQAWVPLIPRQDH
jgi:PAS domain S-box-containing protein